MYTRRGKPWRRRAWWHRPFITAKRRSAGATGTTAEPTQLKLLSRLNLTFARLWSGVQSSAAAAFARLISSYDFKKAGYWKIEFAGSGARCSARIGHSSRLLHPKGGSLTGLAVAVAVKVPAVTGLPPSNWGGASSAHCATIRVLHDTSYRGRRGCWRRWPRHKPADTGRGYSRFRHHDCCSAKPDR